MDRASKIVNEMSCEMKEFQHGRADNESAIRKCTKNISILKNMMKDCVSIGEKQHVSSCIASLFGLRLKIKMFRKVVGSGYSKPNPNRQNYASLRVKWEDAMSAFESRIRTGVITNLTHKDPTKFLSDCGPLFRRRISNMLKKIDSLKVNVVFVGDFVVVKGGKEEYDTKHLTTKNYSIHQNTNIDEWFMENVQNPLLKDLEEFQERDSGWALSSILNLTININNFKPQVGSSYISLPKQIEDKKACINVKNDDEACFAWAVVSALFPVTFNPQRVNKYPHYSKVLKLKGIQFPMTVKQIPIFEKQNDTSINVYILKKIKGNFIISPVYLTKNKKERHVNLLMIQNEYFDEDCDEDDEDEADDIRYHFVWIKDLSRLLSSNLSRNTRKKHFCDRCLHYFYSSTGLDKHSEDCNKLNTCRIRLPRGNEKYLGFKNFKNKVSTPYVIYADLECLLVASSDGKKYQDHIPCSVGYYVKCAYDPTLSFYKFHRGNGCIEWLSSELNMFSQNLSDVFSEPLTMKVLSHSEEEIFMRSNNCHICEKPFTPDNIKVRDHCHLTGIYRGPAHNKCNLNFKDSYTVPVIFHNLSGYDSHFIIESLASDFPGRIDLLPINKERYISFTKNIVSSPIKFRFIDSYRFLASGLDALSLYLPEQSNLRSQFGTLPDYKFKLLTRKGVYPYDYFNDSSKFNETSLPPITSFFNKLNDTVICQDDYEHAQKVWNVFQLNNLGEYSDLYLKTDVLLLADIFEQFRASCIHTYGLDPAHYFTLPGYTWDCMMKHTQLNLELMTDIDMVMFIERGIRGGLSQCSKRYAKANNKYMGESFNPMEKSSYLLYNDINNQYGFAMSQYLPYGGFKWVEDSNNFNLDDVSDESSKGYILEVDLEYPQEVHDLHKDLPFCSDHIHAPLSKQIKLMATLHNKTKYVLHYRNLKQAITHGLKLTKVHRILEFNQSPWLKSYIDLNAQLRSESKNDFEKNLFKLMNNAVFGKTMENVRKHSIVKLVTKWAGRYGAGALISKPSFKSVAIFNDNLVAIELNKVEVYFNKPIYVGMCILDLAKTTIYDFHYNYMIPEFGVACSILYTDTDSLIYEISHDDIYQVIKRDCYTHYDTSDYPLPNPYGIPRVNKKVLGMMKDENNGLIMSEFVGLRAKMYSIRVNGNSDIKKSKGIKKCVVKKQITFDDYVECLNNKIEKTVTQNLIKSCKHQVSSIIQSKIGLSPHDDKRYLVKDSVDTLPWGHYSIMDVEE